MWLLLLRSNHRRGRKETCVALIPEGAAVFFRYPVPVLRQHHASRHTQAVKGIFIVTITREMEIAKNPQTSI